MTGLTGAGWYFSASHHDDVRNVLHGHSYEVMAFWHIEPPRDAFVLQEMLRQVLAADFDHKTLPPELSRAEDIGRAIMHLLPECVGIEVARPIERFTVRLGADRMMHVIVVSSDLADSDVYGPFETEALAQAAVARVRRALANDGVDLERMGVDVPSAETRPMIALLDNGQDLDQCAAEIGGPVGQLLTPNTRYKNRDPRRKWGMDNGGFNEVDVPGFVSLLKREEPNRATCLFVAVPDVVCCARRTLEVFHLWCERPELTGWPLALVCQDGQEALPIPWEKIAAVFIGGSTSWKLSEHVRHIVKAAKILGKHTHAGRVNDPARFQHFDEMGVETCDGTGLARYTHMRQAIAGRGAQPDMLKGQAA